ncbi:hypothetical protein Raf01_36840 [Rugosimonospora africana]|uniref:RmlD-like substrate binding domain-containing protein n=1 Tax=Rugosimonospora africana TaxID=556532 RepID=A0A8J3QSN6_9ACTN|nr:hypothetical protein Raf01_36840 [Rugosimonospora africana]
MFVFGVDCGDHRRCCGIPDEDVWARILYRLVETRVHGVVHVAAQQGITKYRWATDIAGITGLDPSLIRPTEPAPGGGRPLRSWLLDHGLCDLHIPPPRPVAASTEDFLRQAALC